MVKDHSHFARRSLHFFADSFVFCIVSRFHHREQQYILKKNHMIRETRERLKRVGKEIGNSLGYAPKKREALSTCQSQSPLLRLVGVHIGELYSMAHPLADFLRLHWNDPLCFHFIEKPKLKTRDFKENKPQVDSGSAFVALVDRLALCMHCRLLDL